MKLNKICIAFVALLVLAVVPGMAETPDDELVALGWVKNPEQNGYIRILPDVVSSATAVMTGVAARQMPSEAVKACILDFLKGYEKDSDGRYTYREMYQIATARNNVTLISAVEFVLDTKTLKLYAVSERGTEKVEQIADNPAVSLYWVKQIGEENSRNFPLGYFSSRGVQIKGMARIVPVDDPKIMEMLNLYMPTLPGMPGSRKWNQADSARVQRLLTAQRVIEISPEYFLVTDTSWSADKREFHYQQVFRP
jgi:nitroimidazol reductase NimA-like FMN-containing flavoprotein (pyridoxamine 5'-phosphate oxidase superfamily)